MRHGIVKLLVAQALLIIVAAFAMYMLREHRLDAVGAAFYGGGIALINALLLARRTARAAKAADTDARMSGASLMVGMVERFVFTLVAFGLGFALLRLDPPSLLVGFAAPQLAFVLARQS